MHDRKRYPIQPVLESMETRVVPSAMGLGTHHDRAIAAHVDQVNSSAKRSTVSQHSLNESMKHLQQQLALIHTRSLERTPSAEETPAQKVKTETSSLLKSVFASL